MADNDNSIDKFLQELANRSNSLSRQLSEDQQDLSKYLKDFTDTVKKAAEGVKTANDVLEFFGKEIEKRQETDKVIYEKFKKEFLNIAQIDDEGKMQNAFDELISSIESVTELNKEGKESLKNFLLAQKAVEKAKKEAAEAGIKEEKQRRMLERIKSNAKSNVSSLFGALGINYEGDPNKASALYMGLNLIRDGKVQEGMNLLSTYAQLTADAYKNMIDPLNIFINMLGHLKTQTIQVLTMIDAVTSNFVKATGASGNFAESLVNSWKDVRIAGVGLEDISNTIQSLMENYKGFSLSSEQAKQSITGFTSLVARLGAGTDATAKIFGYFADSLKLGINRSKAEFSELLGLVKTSGESIKKITGDFLAALPTLSRYASQTKSVFKEAFAVAKAFRIETSQLLEVASNFDTFETAAESVGKLNALMGGPYLNAIQLMNQTEGQRIVTLNQSAKATGRSWESLGKYGRVAWATAANISDMDLAQRLYNASTAEIPRLMRQATMSQEELIKENKEATTIADTFKNALLQIGIAFTPIIDAIKWMAQAVSFVTDKLGGWSVFAIPLLFSMGTAVLSLTTKFATLGNTLLGKLPAGFGKFLGFGKKVIENVGGIASKISDVAPKALVAAPAIKGLGSALEGLGKASPGIAKGILLIGGAIAVVVAGFMAIKGMAAGFGALFEGAGKGFGKFIEGIGQGFHDWVTESPLEELEDLINTVSAAGPDIAVKMQGIGNGMKSLVESFNKTISQSSVESFTSLIEAIADNSNKFSNTVGISIIDSYARLLEAAGDVNITPTKISDMKSFSDNLVTLSKESGNIAVPTAPKVEPKFEVKIYVDGTELTNSIVKVVKNDLGNSLSPRDIG